MIKNRIKKILKSHKKTKTLIKSTRKFIYGFFNFPFHFIKSSMIIKIRKLDQNYQPFLLTRHDLGTWLQILQYAHLWEKYRGQTAVFILSSFYKEISQIAKLLYPDLQVISVGNWYMSILKKCFGHFCLQTQTFNPIYGMLRSYRLDSIVLYDMPMELEWPCRSAYTQQVDPKLSNTHMLPKEFVEAYKKFRCYSQFRHDHLIDFGSMVFQDPSPVISKNIQLIAANLKKKLGLTQPYVVLNINCKDYLDPILNRRKIHFPERYNVIIDALIQRGCQVVLQGREEQPYLRERKDFIDYSRSNHASLENDIALYSACEWIISSKTGPEIFGTVFDKPTMGLNYVELSSIIPTKRLRYYPKKIRKNKSREILKWQEVYMSPCFFNFGHIHFDTDEEHEYLDMTEEELFNCLNEFLNQVTWDKYSPHQQTFKATLTPLHLEATASPGVPFTCYLNNLS